jgi:hypothetical protein
VVAECAFNLRLIHTNNSAARIRKPPTIPATMPPIAPPERPLLPPDELGVVDPCWAVGVGADDGDFFVDDDSAAVIVSKVNGLAIEEVIIWEDLPVPNSVVNGVESV